MVNEARKEEKSRPIEGAGKKNATVVHKHNTDVIVEAIWRSLLGDFRRCEGSSFCSGAERAFKNGIATYREYKYPELGIVTPTRFKMYRQLENLLKRYRFENDLYDKEELRKRTLEKHFDEQLTFSTYTGIKSITTHAVIQRARTHARRILGKYNPDATVEFSRFGKKSSIGCPLADAYIDIKLSDVAAFSGSSECSVWFFDHVLTKDVILKSLVDKIGVQPASTTLLHDTLKLVLVDKSWKIERPITPLTLLGLFYSYGVGEQVTQCLKDEGLNIATLQEKHARLVRRMSTRSKENTREGGFLATGDLSSASQSLTCDLLNGVLPRDWYNAIKKTFSHQLEILEPGGGGYLTYTSSVLPMGNGLTFPVETLVFYVILKAIADLSECKGLISVYGDDLIYPSKMHRYVAGIFPKLNFKLNLDKTFVRAPFRESCGSDYYRGFDVRSAFVPDQHRFLFNRRYSSFLYKCYNALVRRWDPVVISDTLNLILNELSRVCHPGIFRVPPSYPDTAGVKVELGLIPQCRKDLPWTPISAVFAGGSRSFCFSYLSETPKKRVVRDVVPYYWLALQGRNDDITDKSFWETDYSFLRTAPRSSLNWKSLKRVRVYRSSDGKKKAKVVKKWFAECGSREGSALSIATTGDNTSDDGICQSDWF